MAEKRECFTILEDNTTAEGVKLPARAQGDTVAGNHVPVVSAKDGAGNYQLLPLRAEGAAVTGNQLPVAGAKDGAGNYELVPIRAEGAAVSGNELPVLAVKDSSGNWAHIPLDAAGHIPVTTYPGMAPTRVFGTAIVVPSALDTDTDVVVLTLATSTDYVVPQFNTSSAFHTMWTLVWNDNGTPTVLDSWVTMPGACNFRDKLDDLFFTSGATGTQELKIIAQQHVGAFTNLHGYLSIHVG